MNPYDVLNVRKNASSDDITLAYTTLKNKYSKENYNGDFHFAQKRLIEISKAYLLLSDPKKRADYDKEHEVHTNMHKSKSDKFSSYYNRPNTTEHIHNDYEIAQNKYINSNPSSDDPIVYLENENDSLSNEGKSLSDDFIIFWVFFSIIAIFVIIPIIYIFSSIILFN